MDGETVALWGGGVAFILSWLVQPHFRNLGFLAEVVDLPGHRRPHREPVPRTGGLAIFLSFFASLYFLEKVVLHTELPWSWLGILFGSGLAILALGVLDDRYGIHAENKLYGQLVIIVALMIFGQRLGAVVLPVVGRVELGGWTWPITLFWYLGFVNSMNLIDGLDGLASGIAAVAAAVTAIVAFVVGEQVSTLIAVVLCGTTLAFFYWNVSSRKVFLGDSGSMWLGLVLGSIVLQLARHHAVPLAVLLAPMVVPIWDTGTTIVRRCRKRTSIFQADDHHLHHRLVRLGFTPAGAVLCLLLVTAAASLFALSDFLSLPSLGLPALAASLWAAQLGAAHHIENRRLGLDLYTEILYVLGLDSRLDELIGLGSHHLADVIDLQDAQRRRPASPAPPPEAAPGKVVGHPASTGAPGRAATPRTPRDRREDVLLPTSEDVS